MECLVCEKIVEDPNKTFDLLNSEYFETFLLLTGLKMLQASDVFCDGCLQELVHCHEFQRKCHASQTIINRQESQVSSKSEDPDCLHDDSTNLSFDVVPGTSVSETQEKLPAANIQKMYNLEHQGPFQCGMCGISMRFKRNITEHIAQHAGQRPAKCHICAQSFRTNFILQRHLIFHENSRRLKCPYCPKKFTLTSIRNSHVDLVHFKRAKFQCQLCKASFNHKRSFVGHLKGHAGETKDIACSGCTQKFYFKDDLKLHVRRKHPKLASDSDTFVESELGETI